MPVRPTSLTEAGNVKGWPLRQRLPLLYKSQVACQPPLFDAAFPMILTPLPEEIRDEALAAFAAALPPDHIAATVFDRIRATTALIANGIDLAEHREAAAALAHRLGMKTLDAAPADGFSWDGVAVRTRCEAWVLLHEIAHWQLAPPQRRVLPDFGLGAGPETGRRAEANQALAIVGPKRLREEQLASLLGVLWEVELEQPAILAFIEQNWLEGWKRPGATAFFMDVLAELMALGLLTVDGRPQS